MVLKLYYKNSSGSYVAVSEDDTLTAPISTTHDGKNGDIKTTVLYLRNDDSSLWFSDIEIPMAMMILLMRTPAGELN